MFIHSSCVALAPTVYPALLKAFGICVTVNKADGSFLHRTNLPGAGEGGHCKHTQVQKLITDGDEC